MSRRHAFAFLWLDVVVLGFCVAQFVRQDHVAFWAGAILILAANARFWWCRCVRDA